MKMFSYLMTVIAAIILSGFFLAEEVSTNRMIMAIAFNFMIIGISWGIYYSKDIK